MPSPQAPIGSGFGAASTAAEVIAGRDLTGKTAVVTGGYSGIAVETVRAFRSAGAKVVVPARDLAKAKANLAGMPDIRLEVMDLLDPGSTAWAAFIARTATLPVRFLITTARNCMACDRVQPIPLPRGGCGSSASNSPALPLIEGVKQATECSEAPISSSHFLFTRQP